MADETKPLRKGAILDVDSDDSFADLPFPKYQAATKEEFVANVFEKAKKAEAGEIDLPPLPPPVEH
jgi:hypothetical protein